MFRRDSQSARFLWMGETFLLSDNVTTMRNVVQRSIVGLFFTAIYESKPRQAQMDTLSSISLYLTYAIQAIGIGEEKLVFFHGRDIRGMCHVQLTS